MSIAFLVFFGLVVVFGVGGGEVDALVGGGVVLAAGVLVSALVVDGVGGLVSVLGVGGVGGGAASPGFMTFVAAVVPLSAVKNVGGSSPSSSGLTLKWNPYSVLRFVATRAPMNFLRMPA